MHAVFHATTNTRKLVYLRLLRILSKMVTLLWMLGTFLGLCTLVQHLHWSRLVTRPLRRRCGIPCDLFVLIFTLLWSFGALLGWTVTLLRVLGTFLGQT